LSLRENNFTGPLLFDGIPVLSWVHLDFNSFSGTISGLSASAAHMEVLGLTNNSISGEVPQWLSKASAMETLFLGGNQFNSISAGFVPPDTLRTIDLSANQITGEVPKLWQEGTVLEEVLLFGNRFNGAVGEQFSAMPNLVVLDLHGNKLAGSVPSTLAPAENMKILHLQSNQLSGYLLFATFIFIYILLQGDTSHF